MIPEFLMFLFGFIILNLVLDIFSKKFLHIGGIDLLFFAPWLTATRFGIVEGVIAAITILVMHSFINMRLARFILLSFPAQILAIVFGYFFGLSGFWITLVVYYFASSVITGFLGGLGGGYFMFLLANSITNVIAFFVYQFLF